MEIIPLAPERKKKNSKELTDATVFIFLVKRKERKEQIRIEEGIIGRCIGRLFASGSRSSSCKVLSFLQFMRKRLQNYIFLNRREEFWNIYCVLQFSIAFDLRSNDNIYRRNRTERSCFITSRWIEGQDLFVDNVNVLVLYLSRFVVAFFFLSSFLSYIVLILYSSNIIDYILSSHPEDKKQYD